MFFTFYVKTRPLCPNLFFGLCGNSFRSHFHLAEQLGFLNILAEEVVVWKIMRMRKPSLFSVPARLLMRDNGDEL